MSYSRQLNVTNDDASLGNYSNDRLLSDIKDGLTIIHGYTLTIRQIALDDSELENGAATVLGVVRDGKKKIQDISEKLKLYAKCKSTNSAEEKRLTVQQLSKKYLEYVKNFENESKNYMKQISMKNKSVIDFDSSNAITHDEDEIDVFARDINSEYSSSREGTSINIYDYNLNSNTYKQFNDNHYASYNKNVINNNNRNYKKTHSGRSSEFQSVDSTLGEREKKWFKRNSYVKGNKYQDINEYLLRDELKENKMVKEEEHDDKYIQQEKKFVSVNTMDIENEILKQKNKEIKKLHKDIINIQELYKELSEQINVQGENLDNIDSHIVNTHDNIVMSGREIQIARSRYARNSRCLFFFLFFLILLLIVILLSLKFV